MTDRDLIDKKLARIETCVQELRTLSRPAEILHDKREERFAEHTLQIAIQAALDVASHIVSDERLGEPRTNREIVDLLERSGWIASTLADAMRRMVGFRNILVHGYEFGGRGHRPRGRGAPPGRPPGLRGGRARPPGLIDPGSAPLAAQVRGHALVHGRRGPERRLLGPGG